MENKIEQVKKILYQGYLTDIAAEKINALYSEPQVCPHCDGSGKRYKYTSSTPEGMQSGKCPACNGTGKVPAPSTKQVVCPKPEQMMICPKPCDEYPNCPSRFPHKPDAACDIGFNCPTCIPVPRCLNEAKNGRKVN